MRRVFLALCALPLTALPLWADQLACTLTPEEGDAEVALSFDIDRSQFAPAASPNDPPRQVRSFVQQDGRQYVAEPFVMQDGVRGFWAEERAGGSAILVIDADGAAKMTDAGTGQTLTGQCEDVG